MSLHPTTPRRERLLVFGRNNSGKSSVWLNIADWLSRTNSPDRLHVGSTDHAWDAMRYPDIEPYVNVTDLDRTDFMAWITWASSLKSTVTRDDWVIVDLAETAWDAAQEFYWDKKTGGDMLADIFFENQRAIESKGTDGEYMGGAHGANWGLIKKYYNAFLTPILSLPCHIVFVTTSKEIRDDMPDAATLKAQWKVGWMPAGEKNLPGLFHTWLYCAETGQGHIYTVCRDKTALGQPKRTELKGAKVEQGFVLDYLLPVAGWEL